MAKGRERTQKWYLRNEEEVMKDLGLSPTRASGSGWIEKEDGHNDYVIAQLKSTDKQSYKLSKLDLDKLEHNALVSHKIPMFIIQFLKDDSRYALVNIEDIPKIAEYIETGETQVDDTFDIDLSGRVETKPKRVKKIKSSASSREQFYKEKERYWEEKRWGK